MKNIIKKYKLIILGDQYSGKSVLLNNLKNNNSNLEEYKPDNNSSNDSSNDSSNSSNPSINSKKNDNKNTRILLSYNHTDGIDFCKYTQILEPKTLSLKNKEKYENILFIYDASGNRKKSYFIASYIKTAQICLITINPNNYSNINELEDSILYWVDLFIRYSSKELSNLILVAINKFNTKSKYWEETFKKNNLDINKYLTDLILKKQIYKEIYYLDTYNFNNDHQIIIKDVLSEIHNFNISKIMTKSNIQIKNNLLKEKLYFKKEINYYTNSENASLLNKKEKTTKNKCLIM